MILMVAVGSCLAGTAVVFGFLRWLVHYLEEPKNLVRDD